MKTITRNLIQTKLSKPRTYNNMTIQKQIRHAKKSFLVMDDKQRIIGRFKSLKIAKQFINEYKAY